MILKEINGGGIAQPWLAVLMVAVTALLAVSFHRTMTSRRDLNDDDLVFYYNSLAFDHLQRFNAVNDQVSERLSRQPVDPNCLCLWEKFRFDLREKFRNNYWLFHVVVDKMRAFWRPFTQDAGIDYATSAGMVIVTTYYFCFAAVMVLLWVAVIGFVRSDLVIALAFTIALMLLLDDISPYRTNAWQLRHRPSGFAEWLGWLRSIVFLFISPTHEITLMFPRSFAMLMTIIVVLVRWSGMPGVAYGALAIVIALHQGTGSLVLFTFLLIDAALFPERFRQIGTLVGVVLALAMLLLPNGLLGETTGVAWWTLPAGVVAIIAVLAFDATLARSSFAPLAMLQRWRRALANLGPIQADLVGIAGVWLAWSLLSVVMYFYIGKPNAIYTWGDLPARYLNVFRGPILMGALAIAMAWLCRRMRRDIPAFLAAAACIGVILLQSVPPDSARDVARLTRSLERLEPELQAAQVGQPPKYDETLTYYAISKSIETGTDFLTPLVR